jgi:hypothetical protein
LCQYPGGGSTNILFVTLEAKFQDTGQAMRKSKIYLVGKAFILSEIETGYYRFAGAFIG